MKKLFATVLLLGALAPAHAAFPIFGTVQISTDTTYTPPLQTGAINVSSASFASVTVSTIATTNLSVASSGTISGPVTAGSSVTVRGNLGVLGNIDQPITVTSSTTLNGSVGIVGNINQPVTATSSATFKNNAEVDGVFKATGAVTLGNLGVSVNVSSTVVLNGTTIYAGVPNGQIVTGTGTFTLITVTTITPTGIVGTTTNDNAFTSNYGFYMSTGPTDSRAAATSDQYQDLASTGTTSGGDWNVTPCIQLSRNGASVTAIRTGVSQTSGNSFPEEGLGRSVALTGSADITSAGTSTILCGPPQRWSLTAATTLFLKIRTTYTVATPNLVGLMELRRVR